MFFPDAEKALKQLYRVTKPNGTCYVTSWHRMEHHQDIALRIIKRLRGENGQFDTPLVFWNQKLNDPNYLVSELEKAGFNDCGAETKLEYIIYPGVQGLEFAKENLPKLYAKFIVFKEGEEEDWKKYWNEEMDQHYTSEGVKLKMWANISERELSNAEAGETETEKNRVTMF